MELRNHGTFGSRLLRHSDRVACVRWSGDGRSLLSGAWDGGVGLWDAETGERRRSWRGHVGPVHAVEFGVRSGVAFSCGEDGTLRRWAEDEALPPFAVLASPASLLAMTMFAGRAFVAGADGMIQTIDLDTAALLPDIRAHQPSPTARALSADHRFMMQRGYSGELEIREVDSPATIVSVVGIDAQLDGDPAAASLVSFNGHRLAFRAWPRQVTGLAISTDGRRLYSCGADGGVRCWDLSEREADHWFAREAGVVHALRTDPDGITLWAAGEDGLVRAYRGGVAVSVTELSQRPLLAVCPSGAKVYVAGEDTDIHELDPLDTRHENRSRTPESASAALSAEPVRLRGHFWHVTSLDVHPSGGLLASASKDYTIRIWSTDTRTEVTPRIDAPNDYIDAVAWATDGPELAIVAGSEDGSVRRWALDNRMSLVTRMRGQVHAIAIPPRGRIAFIGDDHGCAIGVDLYSAREWTLSEPQGREAGFRTLAAKAHEEGAVAIGVRRNGEVCRLELSTEGASGMTVLGTKDIGPLSVAAVSADLGALAVGNRSGVVARYRIKDGEFLDDGSDRLHDGDWVTSLAWSPDGSALLSGGWDRAAWLRRDHELPIRLIGHLETVRVCAIAESGRVCVTGSWDGLLYCWDTQTGRLQAWIEVPGRAVSLALLDVGDRTLVATGNADTTVSVLELIAKGGV